MSTSIASAAAAAREENDRTVRREKISAAIHYTVLIIVGFLMLYPLLAGLSPAAH